MGNLIDMKGREIASQEPVRLYEAIRTWLDALNKAQESQDPIDFQRVQAQATEVAGFLKLVQTGHIKMKAETATLLMSIDLMFRNGPSFGPSVNMAPPVARRLVALFRGLEEDIREELAKVSGAPVDPRSTKGDAALDARIAPPPLVTL